MSEAKDIYVAAFLARCNTMRGPTQLSTDEAGMHGLLPSTDDPLAHLLVTDDRAYHRVAAVLPDTRAGMIKVFAAAGCSAGLVDRHPAWRSDTVTAMMCGDLRDLPSLSLPTGLSFRRVRRLPADPHGGVPLKDAVAAAYVAAPSIEESPREFTGYLRSLPSEVRLFAAVDAGGAVRATSGAGAFGADATVMFVNTDPDWRRRGIGLAMTAAALRCARACGARRACLDAGEAGAPIYRRLGFEAVTEMTRFFYKG